MTALFVSLGLVSGFNLPVWAITAAPDTIDFWVLIGNGGSSDSVNGLQPTPNPSNYYLGVTVGEACDQISYAGGGSYTGYFGFWWPDVLPPVYIDVKEPDARTQHFTNYLAPPTPNPTRGIARISYGVARRTEVSLCVYDISGRRVKQLFSGTLEPGNYLTVWTGDADNGSRVSEGVYLLRYQAGDFTRTEKLMMVR